MSWILLYGVSGGRIIDMTDCGYGNGETVKMDKFDMTLIRPLCLVEEKELIRIAEWKGYKKLLKNCPHESTSSRPDLKGVLARLEEINPHARYNLWGSMTHIQKDYLPRKKEI